MDENVNITQEAAETVATAADSVAADQSDAFLEGFDEGGAEFTADQPESRGGEEAQDAQPKTADQPAAGADGAKGAQDGNLATGGDQTAGADKQAAGAQQEQTAPQEWIVKHMDQQRTFTAKDITPELLQKGLDYDRVRSKYDEAKPVMEVFSNLAQQAGMSVADFVKSVRAEQKKAQGMSDADARRAVELEDREAAVAAAEAQRQQAAKERAQRDASVQAGIEEFARAFPEVYQKARGNPKEAIPPEVWDDVNRGLSLTAAYSRYAVKNAEEQVKAVQQRADTDTKNAVNAARSTGSQKSAGNDAKTKDAFLEGFDG